jgi:uncharacterized cupredoxin-like copper-binding protein
MLIKHLAMATLVMAFTSSISFADQGMHATHGKHSTIAFGEAGDRHRVDRTIAVDMNDTMRFTPSEVTVRRGETIRFIVRNTGIVPHEMVLGTGNELKAHGEAMRHAAHAMTHDEPYMAQVPPKGEKEIVWRFTQPGEFLFGCLVPGHFEAGMTGKVRVMQ